MERVVRGSPSDPLNYGALNFSKFSSHFEQSVKTLARQGGIFEHKLHSEVSAPLFNEGVIRSRSSLNPYFDLTISPVITKDMYYNLLNFDSLITTSSPVPSVFQSKDDTILSGIISAYWNSIWSASSPSWRISSLHSFLTSESLATPSPFSLFFDYEFRNWQSIELLEELSWEDSTPANSIYDLYDNLLTSESEVSISREETPYWRLNRLLKKKKLALSSESLSAREVRLEFVDAAPFALEGGNAAPLDRSLNKFSSLLPSQFGIGNIDTSFEVLTAWRFFEGEFGLNFKFYSSNVSTFVSTSSLLNAFRANWEGGAEISNIDRSQNHPVTILNPFNSFFVEVAEGDIAVQTLPSGSISEMPDHVNLRQTARDLIVSSNAIIKVFKSRYDDKRSLARLGDFSELESAQPLISGTRASYETFLNKAETPLARVNFFSSYNESNSPLMSILNRLQNFPPFEMPFLAATRGESARYIWVDWYAKWGFVDVQPSSSARHAIFGMPYLNRGFNFSAGTNINFSETENYLSRISRARKNYLPSWALAPALLSRREFLGLNLESSYGELFSLNSLTFSQLLLAQITPLWNHHSYPSFNSSPMTSSFSSNNLFSKSFPLSQTRENLYFSFKVAAEDSIIRRESLLRSLSNLPQTSLRNDAIPLSPTLLHHFSITLDTLFSRETLQKPTSVASDFNLFSRKVVTSFNGDFKNQYRPMRKGINNLLRLHATGAIAIPTEVRLQMLASSKDVIHSWSVPSAGIKIDCVPGYSSHRIMIFLVSGIFWGQCMEVCGRYHHWMPIVVYFMKRDLFWLWCSHFVFFNTSSNRFDASDRSLESRLGLVSYDQMSWLEELA